MLGAHDVPAPVTDGGSSGALTSYTQHVSGSGTTIDLHLGGGR